ncbi:MAG: bifunctional oligoribonuclease/PAP phosphatase NrnA [Trueperaceae bacterium]|nr:bifunctional oligoribonuclease/PAP phosphatase NrnA [Trueperaceae bacterium]
MSISANDRANNRVDNRGETDYADKLQQMAALLREWSGPIVIVAHVDPDGDALGSSLALKRALEAMGKTVVLPMDPPRFLEFLLREDELSDPLDTLPEHCLLAVLDVADRSRIAGAPYDGAERVINLDHHGTNDRFGDVSCVEPSKAATAQMVKDLLDTMDISWSPDIATPCLTGILTDTGTLRFSNTTPDVLQTVADLIGYGVDYAELTDRLQWRHPDYYKLLGKVMSTVEFPLGGLVSMARLTEQMREEIGPSDDDSDDFVGLIRYAEGVQVAILLKERGGKTKLSVRSRAPVSAQAICLALGGGGHVVAAGATIEAGLEKARDEALKATRNELEKHGYTFEA